MRIFLSLCFFLFAAAFLNADDSISSAELARHLGIYSWRIPRDKLPPFYTLSLRRIQDGRLVGPELIGGGFRRNGDLIICARKTEAGIQLSADDHTMIIATSLTEIPGSPVFLDRCNFTDAGIPFLLIAAQTLPKTVPSQVSVAGHFACPKDYTEAKDGFAMTISKDER